MEFKKTITTIFFVPTLNIDRDILKQNNFINGFSKDVRREIQYENSIYLLFKPINLDKFRYFLEEEYERTKFIIDDYDYEDGYVVVVYKLDITYKKDFKLIKEGKYSQTSKKFQALFPKTMRVYISTNTFETKTTLQYRIFNKTEDLKEFWEEKLDMELDENSEVWTIFLEDKESLDLNKIKEYV
jgi:hypothetical protein